MSESQLCLQRWYAQRHPGKHRESSQLSLVFKIEIKNHVLYSHAVFVISKLQGKKKMFGDRRPSTLICLHSQLDIG